MQKSFLIIISAAFVLIVQYAVAQTGTNATLKKIDSTGTTRLVLPQGFISSIVLEGLLGARHMAVNQQGGIYVKLSKLKDGKGIIYFKLNPDGKLVQQAAFGEYPGTGIFIRNNYLYASSNSAVYRYKLNNVGEVLNPDTPEKIVVGLVDRNRDNAKSIAVDQSGNLFVNSGSYLGGCLVDTGSRRAPDPCPLLDSVGGIWQFKASIANQQYKDGVRYATGFKHSVGLDWNTMTNSLFLLQHGRDQLSDLFPQYFTAEQGTLLPAETMYEVRKGSDGGWPYVYYDHFQHQKMLSPEYGGDGKKAGVKAAIDPIVAFPAHLAPNALLFYRGGNFPGKYQGGAFVSFHGKSAEQKKGYMVGFVPFKNGKPSGEWEIFAEGFLDGKDQHRPCGLAQAHDGSIFVSDDAKGTIYRIQYKK